MSGPCLDRSTISGVHGRVKWPGHYTQHAHEWNLDVESATYEDSAWEYDASGNPIPGSGADGWRTYRPGIKGFSGSISCYQDEVPADFDPDTIAQLELFVDVRTGARWVGCAVLTAIHPAAPIDGMQTVDIDFQGQFNLTTDLGVSTTTTVPATTTTTPAATTTTTLPATTTTTP